MADGRWHLCHLPSAICHGRNQYKTYAVIEFVPGRAMYCFPPTMNVIGDPCVVCEMLTFHTGLPVLASTTSSPPPPPRKISPPAVDSTPDRPAGAGRSHTFLPVKGSI